MTRHSGREALRIALAEAAQLSFGDVASRLGESLGRLFNRCGVLRTVRRSLHSLLDSRYFIRH